MIFSLFALAITAAFFASSLILLNYGRQLGLRYRQQQAAESMAGLPAVEGAVFALVGLLIAFTVSGALHRFDERRQLVIQEANAVSTAYDRLDLFEGEVARNLQKKAERVCQCPDRAIPHAARFLSVGRRGGLVSGAAEQNSGFQDRSMESDRRRLPADQFSPRVSAGRVSPWQRI